LCFYIFGDGNGNYLQLVIIIIFLFIFIFLSGCILIKEINALF
jgi:hypothetical protein